MSVLVARTKKRVKKQVDEIAEDHDDIYDVDNYGGVEPPAYMDEIQDNANELKGNLR